MLSFLLKVFSCIWPTRYFQSSYSLLFQKASAIFRSVSYLLLLLFCIVRTTICFWSLKERWIECVNLFTEHCKECDYGMFLKWRDITGYGTGLWVCRIWLQHGVRLWMANESFVSCQVNIWFCSHNHIIPSYLSYCILFFASKFSFIEVIHVFKNKWIIMK